MDYQKVDGRLAVEYDDAGGRDDRRYAVMVRARAPLEQEAISELGRLGVRNAKPTDSIFPMELSMRDIATLSDRPWIVSIRSSNQLRPLDG